MSVQKDTRSIKGLPPTKSLEKVAQFHETFNLPVLGSPQIPSQARCKLRISLLEEELEELKQAIADNDLVAVADAFCDLQYVLSGAILEFGMGYSFGELFDEVQRSNMSKVCQSKEEAQQTATHYLEKHGVESRIDPTGNNEFLVYRKSDGKVLKSVNYSRARLDEILP